MSPVINKFLVAIATWITELVFVLNVTPSEPVTVTEWLMLAVTFMGALGVFAVPNDRPTIDGTETVDSTGRLWRQVKR